MDSLMDRAVSVHAYIENLAYAFEKAGLFYGHGTDNAFDEAVYLVFVLLGIEFGVETDLHGRVLTIDEKTKLDEAARKRIEERIPVAYLVEMAWFAGFPFHSDGRALVPRSPIAELIGNHFKGLLNTNPGAILDMCTGSGCIGIAAALEFPDALVDLVDISEDCLRLADSNIQLHNADDRVKTVYSDGFNELEKSYDLILCNPPYVSMDEYRQLPEEYLREPSLGLISENNGLALPVSLMTQASQYLNDDGVLIMEVGFSADALVELLPSVEFHWLEFERGGSGVFALTAAKLRNFSVTGK